MSDVQKWTLLMVSDKAGLVAEFGHDWKEHPKHYERVDVVRADLYEQQQKRIAELESKLAQERGWKIVLEASKIVQGLHKDHIAELEAQVAKMFGELNYAELRIQDLRARNGR